MEADTEMVPTLSLRRGDVIRVGRGERAIVESVRAATSNRAAMLEIRRIRKGRPVKSTSHYQTSAEAFSERFTGFSYER